MLIVSSRWGVLVVCGVINIIFRGWVGRGI